MKPYLAQFKQIVEEGRPWVGFGPIRVDQTGFEDTQALARRAYTTPALLLWMVPAAQVERVRGIAKFEPATTEEAIAAGLLGIFQGIPVLTDQRELTPWLTRIMLVRADFATGARSVAAKGVLGQHQAIRDEWLDKALGKVTPTPQSADAIQEALVQTLASLVGAVSLLKRGSKKAASSDRMFDRTVRDCEKAIEQARAALASDPT